MVREIADQLYEPGPDGRLYVGPCGHPASSMWVRDDLLIECASRAGSTHKPTPLHFAGQCSDPASGCVVEKCGSIYVPAHLPVAPAPSPADARAAYHDEPDPGPR